MYAGLEKRELPGGRRRRERQTDGNGNGGNGNGGGNGGNGGNRTTTATGDPQEGIAPSVVPVPIETSSGISWPMIALLGIGFWFLVKKR